ncbi:hypothetical protein SAY86_023047 [Trapa natans]|uniref:FH2 domain-containing protein n=1 Tax=Trapa natans TaxID=22666 RepID=A0AAN7LUD5_TRANT|nr:hypothetical protein SAY86_023047 [Trapa natans]
MFFSISGFSTKSHGNGNDPSSINNLSAISENHDPTLVMVSMEVDAATAVPPLKPSPSKAVPPPPGPPPPPPPKLPAPPLPKMAQPPPVPPGMPSHSQSKSARGNRDYSKGDSEAPKAKLKPFFWDKVMASPDHEMVWHEIKSGSFQYV